MKNIRVLSENFQFLEVKFSIYLNRHVFVMIFFSVFLQESQQQRKSIQPMRVMTQIIMKTQILVVIQMEEKLVAQRWMTRRIAPRGL